MSYLRADFCFLSSTFLLEGRLICVMSSTRICVANGLQLAMVSCLGVRTGMVPIGFVTFAVLRSPSFDD